MECVNVPAETLPAGAGNGAGMAQAVDKLFDRQLSRFAEALLLFTDSHVRTQRDPREDVDLCFDSDRR